MSSTVHFRLQPASEAEREQLLVRLSDPRMLTTSEKIPQPASVREAVLLSILPNSLLKASVCRHFRLAIK